MKKQHSLLPGSAQFMNFLGLLVEGVSSVVALKSLDGVYVFANAAMETALGVPPGCIVGSVDANWMAAPECAEFGAREREVASNGSSIHAIENYGASDRRRTFATTRFPYRDDSGRVIGTGLVGVDVCNRAPAADGSSPRDRTLAAIAGLQAAVDEMKSRAPVDVRRIAVDQSRVRECALQESRRLQRYGHPASLLMLDVDSFTQITDSRGTAAAEKILAGIADVLQGRIRTTDLMGRWGFDQFAIVLTNTGLNGARILAERVRVALMEQEFAIADRITASIGIAEAHTGESLDEWISRAESALQLAKGSGGNSVVDDAPGVGNDAVDRKVVPSLLLLEWQVECESGNAAIDVEHKALFTHAQALIAAMNDATPKGRFLELANALIVHLAAHFGEEEVLFRSAGYLGAHAHAQIHAHLLSRARTLASGYENGENTAGELADFLVSKVIVRHHMVEDTKYFPYLELLALSKLEPMSV